MIRSMIRLRWMLPMVAVVMLAVAGCGAQDGSSPEVPRPTLAPGVPPYGPASGPVQDVQALCGIQGVFWRGSWWVSTPPIQSVRNPTSTRVISGTMTTIGNNQARLDSPDLVSPQILSMLNGLTENTPPFGACAPSTS
jgi:hypothetical protein